MIKSPKQINKFYQRHIGKMVHSFLLQSAGQPEEKVKELYKSFGDGWDHTVRKVNKRYGAFVLSFDAWESAIVKDGYKKIQTSIIPKENKAELFRIIKICEGKTDAQWNRRAAFYKLIFIKVRISYWIKGLFKKKVIA